MRGEPVDQNEISGRLNHERRAALRTMAADARDRARRSTERALMLQAEATTMLDASERLLSESSILRTELQGAVTVYAMILR
jgi:hypothetical protein